MSGKPARRSTVYHEVVSALQMAAEVVLLFLIFSAMLGGFQIEQNSMDPTFHPGQRVIVSKIGSLLPSWLISTAQAASIPCEEMLKQLRSAQSTTKPSDADQAKINELMNKGIERCNADDDKRADDFFAQAMAIMGK